jgi:hypothetical protein
MDTVHNNGTAEVDSRRLPSSTAGVRLRVSSCGISGAEISMGQVSLRVLRISLPVLIPYSLSSASCLLQACALIVLLVKPKRVFTFTGLNGVIYEKTELFETAKSHKKTNSVALSP